MRAIIKRSSSLTCSCCVIKCIRHTFAYIKAEPQAGVAMANQDWETKLENELRIVRRLLWRIREMRKCGDRRNVPRFFLRLGARTGERPGCPPGYRKT